MKLSDTEALRQIIMEEIFDQRTALKALAHLDNIKTDIDLSKVRVTDREDILQDSLVDLGQDHEIASDLLHLALKELDRLDPDNPAIGKILDFMQK